MDAPPPPRLVGPVTDEQAVKFLQDEHPDWQNQADDPGHLLLEACARMAALAADRVNQAPEKAWWSLLRDLGVHPYPATAARTDVSFTLGTPPADPFRIPAGTRVQSTAPAAPVPFVTTREMPVPSLAGATTWICQATDQGLDFVGFPAGDPGAVLTHPEQLLLVLPAPVPGHDIRVGPAATSGWQQLASWTWESWNGNGWTACPAPVVGQYGLDVSVPGDQVAGHCVIVTPPLLLVPHDFVRVGLVRVRHTGKDHPSAPVAGLAAQRVSRVTVPVLQAEIVLDDRVGLSTGHPAQRFPLGRAPLPGQVLTLETVQGTDRRTWQQVTSFARSGPDAPHFRLAPATHEIVLGPLHKDRQYGAVPPVGAQLVLPRYLSGGGLRGNVPANTLTTLPTAVPGVTGVTNPRPAVGGRDQEPLGSAARRQSLTDLLPPRAVTPAEYEDLTMHAPLGIASARWVPPETAEVLAPHGPWQPGTPTRATLGFTWTPTSTSKAPLRLPAGTVFTGTDTTTKTTTTWTSQANLDIAVTAQTYIDKGGKLVETETSDTTTVDYPTVYIRVPGATLGRLSPGDSPLNIWVRFTHPDDQLDTKTWSVSTLRGGWNSSVLASDFRWTVENAELGAVWLRAVVPDGGVETPFPVPAGGDLWIRVSSYPGSKSPHKQASVYFTNRTVDLVQDQLVPPTGSHSVPLTKVQDGLYKATVFSPAPDDELPTLTVGNAPYNLVDSLLAADPSCDAMLDRGTGDVFLLLDGHPTTIDVATGAYPSRTHKPLGTTTQWHSGALAQDLVQTSLTTVPGAAGRYGPLPAPVVSLVVTPTASPGPDNELRPDQLIVSPEEILVLTDHLAAYQAPGIGLHILPPALIGVSVDCELVPAGLDEHGRRDLVDSVKRVLNGRLNPYTGAPAVPGWPAGTTLHVGDVYALLEPLAGIRFIKSITLYRVDLHTGSRRGTFTVLPLEPHETVLSVGHTVRFV
ncbi:hypothetical protein ACFVVA_17425 [Kitasatospora sp. NPDC058048]|uniref:hypothetical protein n=1 Tax=Kitasatospora sp. NPDC058048 TaxID=3346313 RepID=UPI0036DF9819